MVQDSVWHRKQGLFRQYFNDIADKTITVKEALSSFREQKYIPSHLKNMKIQDLYSNPRWIEELFYALKQMPPERRFRLPYNKAEREQELIELLAEDYNIDQAKAQSKIASGHYNDGSIAFNYCLEAAMAPFSDASADVAGEIKFIGNINSGMHIDGGASFFSNGHFEWHDKRDNRLTSDSVRGILHECGFSTNVAMSKRRFYSVLYLNLLTEVPDWTGGAGKTHIELAPYANVIAKTVSSLAYKMPSYHGQGYGAVAEYYSGGKDENQIAQNYYLDFLKERYNAIQANPALRTVDRITQSGVWYRVHKVMVKNHFRPKKDWGTTRESLTNQITKFCETLSRTEWGRTVTREDLGIIASSRAIMYFDGHEYPIGKDNISTLANAETTDIIVIEKEGMADTLKEYADEYHIALVFTRGRFVDYVVELIEAAISKVIDIKVWTLTDYDVDGMEIASAVDNTKVPRIGIDSTTVEWLQNNGYPNLTLEDVEEEHYARDAETRTGDEFLWSKRIELDSIHSEIGGEGLWKYIIYQIKSMATNGRDYTEIVSRPEPSHLYPKEVNQLLDYFTDFFDALVNDEYAKIEESELKDVKNKVLKIDDKKTSIRKRLITNVVTKSEAVDTITNAILELLEGGDLPEVKDGYVSEATLERQKEESDRSRASEKLKDDNE